MNFWLRLFWFGVKAALAVLAVVWLAGLGGAATLDLGGWRVETTVGMLAVFALAACVVAILAYRLWRGLADAPGGVRRGFEIRRLRRGYGQAAEGFAALAAGQAAETRRIAGRLTARAETRPLGIFLDALAARQAGDEVRAAQQFRTLMADEKAGFLGVRGLLTAAKAGGDAAAVEELLAAARRARPGSPWAAQAQFALAVSAKRYDEAQTALAEGRRAGAFAPAEAARLEAAMAVEQARAAESAGRTEAAYAFARQAYKAQPRWAPAVAAWAEALLGAGKRRRAVKILEEAWAAAPHPMLVRPFLDAAPESNEIGRAAWAARLTLLTPEEPEALLAQADAALKAQLWGEARRLLQAVLRQGPSRRAYRLMAEFARARPTEAEGTPESWLEKAAEAPPPAGWRCRSCGARHARWVGTCEPCGAFASLEWTSDSPAAAPAAVLAPEPAFPLLDAGGGGLSGRADARNT
jgi:HemY protein